MQATVEQSAAPKRESPARTLIRGVVSTGGSRSRAYSCSRVVFTQNFA